MHLTRPGDWVETHPISRKEYYNIQDAAHAWAWAKNVTIKTESIACPGDKKVIRITLVKLHRNRDYD